MTDVLPTEAELVFENTEDACEHLLEENNKIKDDLINTNLQVEELEETFEARFDRLIDHVEARLDDLDEKVTQLLTEQLAPREAEGYTLRMQHALKDSENPFHRGVVWPYRSGRQLPGAREPVYEQGRHPTEDGVFILCQAPGFPGVKRTRKQIQDWLETKESQEQAG